MQASTNQVALEFACFVLKKEPADSDFLHLYDAMSRAAASRSFRNLGHQELAQLGVSFSLLQTETLEHLIAEAHRKLLSA
ncbi:MAG: hypothetical protein BroJett011_42250 [Chloroflexota bacterium]|nr:MAG: hypothetical protein BroJett011_42250 [Chloroflexota bacterium]